MGLNVKQLDIGNDIQLIDGDGNLVAEIGRGTTDTDITFLLLKNADGESAYIFPNAAQTGIVVQATKP